MQVERNLSFSRESLSKNFDFLVELVNTKREEINL